MARKRKNEMKTSVKSSLKYTPVRKSSRQIAKKQLEDKKLNGDILTSCSNSPKESKITVEDQDQTILRKIQVSERKHSKHKHLANSNVTTSNSDAGTVALQYKRDAGESDSQDGLDNIVDTSEKLSPEDVRQMVVGNPNPFGESVDEPISNDIEVWPEDVIEETIICEEMEVDDDIPDSNYALSQRSNVLVEQVLLLDEPNAEGKNFLELTVIRNSDGSESMVMASNSDNTSGNAYHIIEEGIDSLHMNESENSVTTQYRTDAKKENHEKLTTTDKCSVKKSILNNRYHINIKNENQSTEIIRKENLNQASNNIHLTHLIHPTEDSSSSAHFIKENVACSTSCNTECPKESTQKPHEIEPTNNGFNNVDSKLAIMQISESSREIQKLVNDLSNTEGIGSPVQAPVIIERISEIEDDDSNSSILDKMEQLHQQNSSATSSETIDIYKNILGQTTVLEEQVPNISKSNAYNEKIGPNKDVLVKTILTDKKNLNVHKNTNHLHNISDLYKTTDVDCKIDVDDVKSSSSSENSNDTLLSTSSTKVPEQDVKGQSCLPIDAEKKHEFRSRSGSTDTTGSESGSNSSTVRRSSRIRSIGLMKQRSRGRGLVTKPNVDASKNVLQPEREKSMNTSPLNVQDLKLTFDKHRETQCDKENNSSKCTSTCDSLTSLTANCSTTGYDSDSSKPVKVKSRWRRSSELEMGGTNSGIGPNSGLGLTLPITCPPESSSRLSLRLGTESIGETESTAIGSGSANTSINPQPTVTAERNETTGILDSIHNPHFQSGAKNVGARISLPMVLETKDREMEERLSQFEHLCENLYLTERYTNKETKRMVCDCFLTEEEIERGELGCGEDCLNRLLMIECGSRCVVEDRCTNKRFQNCEYAKCEVFRTEKKGFGLRAVVDLPAGEFIMEYVGEVVDPKDFRRRAKEYSKDKNRHYYFMALKSDQIIDATMKGNVSRFINHSCDPNSETQKWTVNGELRIGFFNKKFIAAGEEITFDYHFQRYGKEAQKCFCEAPNCRGWIGDTPEEEKEKIEKKEKREKDVRKKKEEKKPANYMEDEDLEEEIDKLCLGGLKNRAHTLTLSRLMVRSRELEHRTRLLRLIQSGEQPCRRLFLDYHGLRLIWSYVMDIAMNDSEEAQQFRLEVLKTLNTLPIPNKTMLMDSKIYGVVEKWAKCLYLSPNGDSPEDDQVKPKISCEEQDGGYENNEKKNLYQLNDTLEKSESNIEGCVMSNEIKSECADQTLISDLALNLLAEWSNLKEVFRIPKKERIEQMKEHEREADRGYREELEKEEKRENSYDRHRSDRYGRIETDKRIDKRRGRESPEAEHNRTKDKRIEERSSLVPIPRMSKYERRQLFALKVAKEEEERQRRQQQESWQEHETRCVALGVDPHATAMLDPQTGYPVFYNPSLGQWQHYSTQDTPEITQQCTPVYIGGAQSLPGHSQAGIVSQTPHVLPQISSDISPGMTTSISPGAPPVVYSLNQTPVFNQTTPYSLLSNRHQQYPEGQLPLSSNLVSVHDGTLPIPVQGAPLYVEKSSDREFSTAASTDSSQCRTPQVEIPPIDLPPKWKSATDARGRIYYYHIRERISQWLPPPPDHIGVHPDSSSTSESSEESSSSNEDDDIDDDQSEGPKVEDTTVDSNTGETTLNEPRQTAPKKIGTYNVSGNSVQFPECKKRRDGLVQERIISPRREEDRMDHKVYKEIKEKLRRQKERAKLKEHVDKVRKHRRSNKSKSHWRHGSNKLQSSADVSSMSERKIKDTFRINMANVMVHFLNPYRKNDCKQGRITNTEDFKHLARKLTHFVLAKELKHCKSVDELQCNENVKHKAKDFVRKYMSKFGAVYQKGTDED